MNYAEGITDDAQNISEPKNEAKSLKAAIRSSGRCRPSIDSVNHMMIMMIVVMVNQRVATI